MSVKEDIWFFFPMISAFPLIQLLRILETKKKMLACVCVCVCNIHIKMGHFWNHWSPVKSYPILACANRLQWASP